MSSTWAWTQCAALAIASLAKQAANSSAAGVDLWQGALVNILSPHPWLFWITIGAPTLTQPGKAAQATLAFLLGFYALLLGGKITVAMAVAGGRRFLTDAWYRGCWSVRGHYCACLGCCCCGKSPGFGCE